jgi:TATA-box binding protein (TBP) (component of TFIID and TFIIIB)
MFLNLLSAKEKLSFLGLAKKVIYADNIIAKNELVMYKSMHQEMEILEEISSELSEEEMENVPEEIPKLCGVFDSRRSKISALMELVALCFVDGKLVVQEKEVIYEIARHFDIKREETDSYIDWASRLYTP